MSDYLPPADGWTVDDLDAMPEDGVHRELHTYKIDPESEIYRPFGTFDVEIDTAEPWPIKVPIAQIKPRFL
ncbi:hypothetical protein [Paractinoplanes toevensis]|nr:hypothetical protein [Actinoplanes toevensis]